MENKRQYKHSENCKIPFYVDATQINTVGGGNELGTSWERRVGKSKIRLIVIRFVVDL
jgi:hypothetical protein